MAHLATVAIENGVFINPDGGCITVVRDGEIFREYCTPREGQYVKYWHGEGYSCEARQEFTGGQTGSSGWFASAISWPSDDKIGCARWIAKRYRMKLYVWRPY